MFPIPSWQGWGSRLQKGSLGVSLWYLWLCPGHTTRHVEAAASHPNPGLVRQAFVSAFRDVSHPLG